MSSELTQPDNAIYGSALKQNRPERYYRLCL